MKNIANITSYIYIYIYIYCILCRSFGPGQNLLHWSLHLTVHLLFAIQLIGFPPKTWHLDWQSKYFS